MSIQPYSEEQILARMRFENPWWTTGHTSPSMRGLRSRLYFEQFMPFVERTKVRRAIVLMGPRRVGKTVMMQQTIERLLAKNVNPLKIAFLSVETPIYSGLGLEQLFALVRKATNKSNPKGWYVFFDEIQYLKDWEVHLKSLVDSYPETRFIVSGSAAAALRLKSNESGAGRFTDFLLPPLTFSEYIHLKELERIIIPGSITWEGLLGRSFGTTNITELNKYFLEYINFGGYPEVIFNEDIRSDPGSYVRTDIIDKVLLRDLPMLYGINDVQELNALFSVLAYNTGNEVAPDELARTSGVNKNMLKKYMEYLEAAFLIKRVHRTAFKPKRFERANFFKVYVTNTTLRTALFAPVEMTEAMMGNIIETAIFSQWMHRRHFTPYYARGEKTGEVDIVALEEHSLRVRWAAEVKWSNRYSENPRRLKSLMKFVKENNLRTALVTSIDKESVENIDGVKIIQIPCALYCYTVGMNTLLKNE